MPEICFAGCQCYARDIIGSESQHLDAFIKNNQLPYNGRILPPCVRIVVNPWSA